MMTETGELAECLILNHQLFQPDHRGVKMPLKPESIYYPYIQQGPFIILHNISRLSFPEQAQLAIAAHSPFHLVNPYITGYQKPRCYSSLMRYSTVEEDRNLSEREANRMSGSSVIVPFGFFRPGEESFEIFVQRFEAAFEANALEEKRRMPIFVSLLDSEMLKLGNDLFFPSTMREQPYELLIQRIKLHLAPRKKVIPQRCRFLKRIQLESESVSEYLRELRHLAMDCTFGEMLEVMLRDRFVAGIKSESLQKKLLQEDDDVTLDRVFSIAVSFELAEQNAKELQDGLVAKMDIVPGGNRKIEARRGWQHGPGMQRRETICFRCGEKNSHLVPACPHKTKSCFKCKRIGHLSWCAKRKKVENEIDGMVNEGILQPIEYANWAAPIVPVLKKDGSLRICGDFRCTANKAIELDKYPLPSIDEIFSKLSGNTVFSSLDLSRAYLQVRLSEEAKRVVNINTTKGLFAFKRLPYGVAVAPNKFQREMDNLFADMSGVACYIDDILVAGKDHRDHEQKLELVFKRLQEKGLRLNKDKCKYAVNAVEYLGFKIDKKGLHPISSKIEAVVEAPEPTNIYKKYCRYFGALLSPLKKNSKWNWTGEHRILFAKCKALLTNESVLAHYDATRELVLACDASIYGLGVVLSHRNDRKEETPIAFASRTLTEAERRYSQLEKEALSIIFGCEKFRQYLLGREFVLITDNRPLMHIFSPQKSIPICAASRIKRWSLKLSAFKYTVEFRKTDDNGNADALSRLPLVSKTTESLDEDQVLLLRKMSEVPFSFQDVAVETRRDKLLSIVLRNVRENNWIKDELSCEFGCLQWRERVVIPQKLRSSILNDLHEMHLGMVKMKMIARRYFWWPGIDKNIEELARDCRICQESASMPPSTISEWTWPEKPWHRLHLDLAGPFMGRMFMVLVDAYTKWLEIVIIKDITSRTIIGHLREIFGRSLPDLDYLNFCTNGLAERYVREFKNSLRKNQGKDSVEINLQRFLFAHRAFPQTVLKESPAELLMKRNLRSRFSNLIPKMAKVGEVYHDAMRKQKHFAVGSEVYFRNFANGPKWKRGRIMELLSSRHYLIEDEGRYVKRHINQLRPVIKKEVPEVRDLALPGTSRDFILPGTSRDHPGLGGQEKTREEAPEVDEELKGAESSAQEDTPEPEPGPAAAAVPVRSPRPQRSRRPPEPEPGPAAVPVPVEEDRNLSEREANRMSGSSVIVPFGFFRPGEESFEIFVQRFEAAFEANALEEKRRMPIFVSLLDSELLKLGNDLFFPSTMREQPYELLIQRIKLHLAPRKKVIPQRCRFLKRIQLESESVSEYLRELRHLAMDCTFGEMLEVMLRDRFVAGIKSESLQKKLLQEDDDVTLDRVFSIAVSFELAEQNAKELQDGLVAKMDIVPGGNRKIEARRGWQHGPGMQRRETICFRCGEKNSHLDKLIYSVQGDTDAKIDLHVDEYQLCFVVDTGSPVTLIPKTIYEKYWKDGKLSPSYLRLRSFCGNPIKIIGERRVFVKEANQDLRLIVVDEDISIVLLGREWLKGLNLDFSRLLNIRQKKVENEIDGMVNEGILQPIEYANWAAPIVPVLKKDGSLRICGDFRCTANKAIELDKYPLPSIDEIFSKLSGNTVFSSLDLSRAYLQVRLSEEAKRVVNINTTKGLFAFKRLPYGVAVAPNKFQREMDNLFADMSGVACYIDDILVAGKDHRDHEQKLELVFKRLQEKGLRLNKDKCKFAVNAVEYLGFKIDKKGLHPISSKIEAVVEAPEPTNIYKKYCRYFGALLSPLKKNSKWNWTGEHRILFAKCKALLTNESVLAHYDATRELVLACDASIYGLGVVLSHRNDRKEETPIAFASRTLTEAERRYSQLEKEALSIIFGCEKFRQYLLGREFVLITDNRPLMHIFSPQKSIPICAASRIKRWSLKLSAFKYTVEFRKTDDNGNADALSRLPLVSKTTESLDEDQVLLLRKMSEVPFSFQDVAVETRRDKLLSIVLRNVRENNWQIPKVSQENPLCSYYRIKDELSCEFGCLQWRERVVIPQKLRSSILNDLHEMHLGMVKMKMIARRYFWWPGIDKNIEELARDCRICQESASMPPSTISEWTWPEKPWHRLHLDLAGPFMGRMFMVLVDAYTKWLEIVIIKDITSRTIIGHLREIFGRSLPDLDYLNFCTNGLAERYVREFKNSLRKNQGKDSVEINLQRFLFAHRAFPQTVLKESPAELLMKRNLRSRFSNLIPKMAKVGEVYHDAMRKQKHFAVGSEVYFRNFANGPKWKRGRIMELLSSRHYLIEDEGRYVKRHINQLRPVIKKEVPEVRDLALPGTSRDFILPGTSRDHPGLGGQEKTREEAPEVDEELKGAESSAQEDTPEPEPGPAAAAVPVRSPRPQRSRRPPEPEPGPAAVPVPVRSPRPQRSRRPPDRLHYY
ncbi:hypothetical protein LAZ67_2000885 [Cordylochernes scorpioides]|uniref:RNA-directed DNA polymerase n=1 Tax=Cordylochernes scorpioides TaxID=51811 RepID=A0ABY6K5I1_9ARAC|nr:hypothetical protein LAZ67_2000885 [Cordylochernes scorpioides]